MVINWYGEGSFKVQTGGVTIATDPFEVGFGLTPPRFKADIILKTSPFGSYVSDKTIEGKMVVGPGEYEIQGVEILGFQAGKNTIYVVKTEETKLAFFGGLSPTELAPDVLAELRSVDIAFVPIGGAPYLDAIEAASLLKKIEPRVVIPCFYKILGLKREAADVTQFAKTLSQHPEPQEKLTIKARDINWEGIKLVILKI